MTDNDTPVTVTPAQLAHLGEGTVAYLREMTSDELKGKVIGFNTVSVTSENATSPPNCNPMIVITGTKVFFSA